MSLRDRVPVEPLDDDRLARIERAVVARLPARVPRPAPWRAMLPWAVAALAVTALAWWRSGRDHAAAPTAAPLAISAAPEGTRIDLGDAVVLAGGGASFTVTRPAGGVDITLARGRIELEVESRHGRPPLLVHADDVEVVVVGTRFAVERGDEVSVTVTEGVVRVRRGGDTTTVAAGQAWSGPVRVAAAADDDATVPPLDDDADDAPPSGGGSGEHLDVLHDRVAAVPPPGDGEALTGSGGGAGKRPSKHKDGKPSPTVAADPLDELRHAISTQTIARAVDVDGTGAEALKAYERMAVTKDDSAVAAQGLYGMARVQHVALGKDNDALRNLGRYLQRFPSGKETRDVLWLRLRILCLRKLDDACRSAAHTYLTRIGGEAPPARIAERITVTP